MGTKEGRHLLLPTMSQNRDVNNALQIQRQIRKQEEHDGKEKELQDAPKFMKVQTQQAKNSNTKRKTIKEKKSFTNDEGKEKGKEEEEEEEKRNDCDDTTTCTLK